MRMIYCEKLQQQAEGLEQAPLPGERGQKIYNSISKEAWNLWLKQQTILINEYRLNLIDAKSRAYLLEEMDKFLFQGGAFKEF